MEFIIDSADTAAIRRCIEFFPVAGVTTNPTIISKEKAEPAGSTISIHLYYFNIPLPKYSWCLVDC